MTKVGHFVPPNKRKHFLPWRNMQKAVMIQTARKVEYETKFKNVSKLKCYLNLTFSEFNFFGSSHFQIKHVQRKITVFGMYFLNGYFRTHTSNYLKIAVAEMYSTVCLVSLWQCIGTRNNKNTSCTMIPVLDWNSKERLLACCYRSETTTAVLNRIGRKISKWRFSYRHSSQKL